MNFPQTEIALFMANRYASPRPCAICSGVSWPPQPTVPKPSIGIGASDPSSDWKFEPYVCP